jgi:hypothetical protein
LERRKRTRYGASHIFAGVALLALFLQIIAVALCPCESVNAFAGPMAQAAAMPDCHHAMAPDAPSDSTQDKAPAPGKQTNCPFCAAHCHAPLVFAAALGSVDYFAAVATTITPAHVRLSEPVRFSLAASPRGPPASI